MTFHFRNFKMGSEILDAWSQILVNVLNINYNQNNLASVGSFKIKIISAVETYVTLVGRDRGNSI